MKHILITGGAGFIGSRLANHLIAKGHKVRVLDNLSPQIHGPKPKLSSLFLSLHNDIDFMHGSVINQDDFLKSLHGIDTVVHLAAETGTGQSMYDISHYSNVNVGGTALLLDLIANKKLPIKKIVVASSRAVYGEGKYLCQQHSFIYPPARSLADMEHGRFDIYCPLCGFPAELVATDEEAHLKPVSIYGLTKLAQEQMVLMVAKALNISAIALRYQNIFGPGQSLLNPYTGILSIFSTRILNKGEINIFEDGNESRDYLYIDDAVSITALAVLCDEPLQDVFNVGAGISTSVLDIAFILQKLFGFTVKTTVSGCFRIGDIRHNFADLGKVKKVLGFKPSVSISKGLENFVNWVKNEKLETDNYEQSLKELRDRGLLK